MVYRRIRESLSQIYPRHLSGRQARHMNTLAGMVSGIVRSGKSHLKAMAKQAPDQSKVESRIKRYSRYLQNEGIDAQTYFFALAELHLQPGDCLSLSDVYVTQDQYGPVLVVAWWRKDRFTWSPTWSWLRKPVTGMGSAFGLKLLK